MKIALRLSLLSAALAVAVTVRVSNASATGTGLAYDSVTSFPHTDATQLQPGSFESDFQTASAVKSGDDAKRGPFGLGRMIAQAQNAMSMLSSGMAEHHYIAGSKERTDTIALGRAEITDCAARTLTTLDLAKKTYTVTSLDQPNSATETARHSATTPGTRPTDDGSRMAIAVSTKALGARNIQGMSTTGYDADVRSTVRRGNGESHSFDMLTTSYYSGYAEPAATCRERGPSRTQTDAANAANAAMLTQYRTAMRALRTPKGDPRFTVTAKGPSLPVGKLALYELVSMKGQQQQGPSFSMLVERGNVRTISENDPVFGVPADFTKT